MQIKAGVIASAAALAASFFGLCAAQASASPPVSAYARLPKLTKTRVSPEGGHISARMEYNGRYAFVVYKHFGENDYRIIFATLEDDELEFNRLYWAREDRLVASLEFASKRYRVETTETRLFGLDPDGSNFIPLFRVERASSSRAASPTVQIQDRIVSLWQEDDKRILVQYNAEDPSEPQVHAVKIDKTSRHSAIQHGQKNVQWWTADWRGRVRMGEGVKAEKSKHLTIKLVATGKWKNLSHRVADGAPFFEPLSFAEDPDKLYVVSGHEFDPAGLYLYNAATDAFERLLFRHRANDITSVVTQPGTGKLQGVNYASDEGSTHWLEETPIARTHQRLNTTFPGKDISIVSKSRDEKVAIVRVDGPNDPGRLYVFQRIIPQLIKLPPQYPELESAPMGRVVSTQYAARDGLSIPAFVTLPVGIRSLAEAKNLPFVVMPHGGPNARTFLNFDYEVQFLASRGYGVLQMNFRGSSGYGEEFMNAGDKQWGQAMQDDITDGARWLISKGTADPGRIAISGGSYGGYAALMGAVKTPNLYQCAISFAGVTDLPDLIRDARHYINGRYATRFIGNLWREGSMLRENSPARRADDIRIPILLMHGEKDRVVDIGQSKKMARTLERSNKDVTYIEFENGDHYLSLYANRLRFLEETERFLSRCLH